MAAFGGMDARPGPSPPPSITMYRAAKCPTKATGTSESFFGRSPETRRSPRKAPSSAHSTGPSKWQRSGFHLAHLDMAKKQFQVCSTNTDTTFQETYGPDIVHPMANYGPREETLTPNWKSDLRRTPRGLGVSGQGTETASTTVRSSRVGMGGPFWKAIDSERG